MGLWGHFRVVMGTCLLGVLFPAGAGAEDQPPVSKPTPTVEAGMPLFSSDEIGALFVAYEPPAKKEHPIFVGVDDDIVEMQTFNVYSDELTLRQSLAERLSDPAWQAMIARIDQLDPQLSAQVDYDRKASDRFFSSQTPGGAADRPAPGGITAGAAVEATLKAVNAVFGP